MISRVTVFDNLFALLGRATFATPIGGATTWLTKGQRLQLWGKVAPSDQPAMFLAQHREQIGNRRIGLTTRQLMFQAWCYARTDDAGLIGGHFVDTMLEAIEVLFVPDDPSKNEFTMNRAVSWCRIEGRVLKDPGDIDSQALLVVPIIVQMP